MDSSEAISVLGDNPLMHQKFQLKLSIFKGRVLSFHATIPNAREAVATPVLTHPGEM